MIDWRTKGRIIQKVVGYLINLIEEYDHTPYEDEEMNQKKERALSVLGRDTLLSKLDRIEEKKQIRDLIYEIDLAVIYWVNQGSNWDAEVYQEVIDILSSYVKD